MSRPSTPLLTLLRDLARDRGVTTAALAQQSGIPRGHLRKILGGGEPMTVDELLLLAQTLDISPADMGLGELDPPAAPSIAPPPETPPGGPTIDPWGNHPEQLLRAAFDLGCDVLILATTDALADSKLPATVLTQYKGGAVPIKLDAAYHSYNAPRFDAQGVTLTLSFDALYDCTLPWSSIQQLVFYPEQVVDEPTDEAPPRLRLIE